MLFVSRSEFFELLSMESQFCRVCVDNDDKVSRNRQMPLLMDEEALLDTELIFGSVMTRSQLTQIDFFIV
jgi:hypothetical protein